jgi:hypothetical protein
MSIINYGYMLSCQDRRDIPLPIRCRGRFGARNSAADNSMKSQQAFDIEQVCAPEG